ncbi:MAG TPA: Ig-like domain-containing protein, partial [candidate division Zixibacteria bacterium]|nr:Ig-like domain-containing protein [candidate division Zixibacteria bacterium]
MLFLILIISISVAGNSENGTLSLSEPTTKIKMNPKIESNLLTDDVEKQSAFTAQFQNQSTKKVVFELAEGDKSYIKTLEDSGAKIEAVHKNLVQASVPVSQLQNMSELPFVNYMRTPGRPFKHVISEGAGVINAIPLNNMGIRGQGVKIAILDVGFDGYQLKRDGNELPASVTPISFRGDGDITGGGENHGTAVAEIIYDIAPDAQMYLINFETEVEFANAVDYAIIQNIDIISMSLGWLGGPFDGTSIVSAQVDSAAANGIVWTNSAGNYAQRHWEGQFSDPDNNGINNFTSDDENMTLSGGGNIDIFLSWDGWPASDQDYDLYLYNSTGDLIAFSDNPQTGFENPAERITRYLEQGIYSLQIKKYIANSDPRNFELYSAYQNLEYQVPSSSLSTPADAQGAITVGATTLADSLEPFSSRGPTNDDRTKPDVVAPDGVSTSTYGSKFYGTSASAPHVAGAAALLKSINSSLTPAELRSALQSTAKFLGPPNLYGSGRIDILEAAKIVDKRSPTITITFPEEGMKWNSSAITVTGTTSDDGGVSMVEIRVGTGSWQTASGTTSWSAPITLSEGQNTIFARAIDIAGRIRETSVTVTSDTTFPAIAITSHSNGQKLNASAITVTGTASDNDGLSTVEIRVGTGSWQTAQGTSPWSAQVTLSEGQNIIFARAIDTAGNVQETSVTVTSDTTLPAIAIISHSNGQKLNASAITVTGTASDNDGVNTVEIRVGAGSWQTASGTTSWSAPITLSDGQNTIFARAIDIAGNVQETSVTVTSDTIPPAMAITSHSNGQKLNASIITVTGTASDNIGLNTVEVRVGAGSWQTAQGTSSWSAQVTLSEGQNIIFARATDMVGNTRETTLTVNLDTGVPTITIITPIEGQKLNTLTITVTGIASDDIGLSTVEVKVGNGKWQAASGTTSWSASVTLSEGLNKISARATDNSGNAQRTSVNVTLDSTPPSIGIIFPTEGRKLNTAVINVTGTASDTNLSRVEVSVGNGNWQQAMGTASWSASVTLSERLNMISVRGIDIMENIQVTSVNVTLDTITPNIVILVPTQGQKLKTNIISVTGTASDNDGVRIVEIRVGTGSWQQAQGTTSWNASIKLSQGQNMIFARTMDIAGNADETSVNVTLDTTPPNLSIIFPVDDQQLNMTVITVTGTASDNDVLSKVEVSVGNGSWQQAQGTTSWSAPVTLSEGQNMISARASDIAGNNRDITINVTLDTKKPEVTNLTVLPSTPVINQPVEIKLSVSDEYLNSSSIFARVGSSNGDASICRKAGTGFNCSYTNTSWYGRYNVSIIAVDLAGNINNTEKTWFVTKMKPYENNSVNTVRNNVTIINALNEVNTTLELVTSSNVNNGTIKITMSSDIPPEINQSMGLVPFGKYISINSSMNNLNWMKINIYYTEVELNASGLDENSLRIYYYNESNKIWETLSKGSPSWVNDAGANTANTNTFSGFVWTNLSHQSTFALVGNYLSPAQSNGQVSSPS